MFACVVMNCDGTRAHLFLTLHLSAARAAECESDTSRRTLALTETSNLRPQITSSLRSLRERPIVGLIDCDSLPLTPTPARRADYLFSRNINIPHSTARRAKLLLLRKLKSLPENPRARLDCSYLRRAARKKLNCVFSELLCGTALTLREVKVPGNSIKFQISRTSKHACEVFVPS
jgi:hypothetical protein